MSEILVWWDELHIDTWIKRNSKYTHTHIYIYIHTYIHTFTQTCVCIYWKELVIFINFIKYTQIPYFAIDITKKKRKEKNHHHFIVFFIVACNHS